MKNSPNMNDAKDLKSFIKIDVKRHQDSLPSVFSKKLILTEEDVVDEELLSSAVRSAVLHIQQWVMDNGGIVGHIKAMLDGPRMLWVSATGADPCVRWIPNQNTGDETVLYFTAIAVNIDLERFMSVCDAAYRECLDRCFQGNTPTDPGGNRHV